MPYWNFEQITQKPWQKLVTILLLLHVSFGGPLMQHLCSMNTACRHYFQKPPDRIVHLSNLSSAAKTELAYGGVLCSAFSQLPVP